MSSQASNTYFALKSSQELANDLAEESKEWQAYRAQGGMAQREKRSHELYFGEHFGSVNRKSPGMVRTGLRGEIVAFAVNHYRNLIKHQLTMATNQKPSFDVRAINSDDESQQQARLGVNILDYYWRDKELSQYCKKAAEQAQVYAKGYLFAFWDPSLGVPAGVQDVTDDEGNPKLDEKGEPVRKIVYEGDLCIENPLTEDVIVDPMARDWAKLEWAEVTLYRNKWNLVAQYPKHKEEIAGLDTLHDIDNYRKNRYRSSKLTALIPVRYFIHKKTRAVPNGRLMIRVGDDIVLYDDVYPYDDKWPLFRICPGEIFGTTEGYSDAFDLIGIQEAIDTLVTIAFTNQQAHGVQKVWMPTGGDISSTQISQALTILRSPPGTKPEPLQLTQTAKEIFDMLPMLQKWGETTYGVNSVVRGDPDHSLDSGVALGLVQAMAVQYASAFQQSWAQLLQDVASFILYLLKEFCRTERKIDLGGKMNRGYMTAFTGKSLSQINRAVVDLGNPMARTFAGRVQLADKYLEKGFIQTPQQYETVVETGSLEAMTENLTTQLSLIKQEKEALLEGQPVRALPGDKHLLHMQDHYALISNPEVRMNSRIVEGVLAHIMEHKNLYQTQDPIFAMISGEPPPPPPPMLPMPPGAPGMPPAGPQAGPPPGPGGPGPMMEPPMPPEMSGEIPPGAAPPPGLVPGAAMPPQGGM